jgi:hypothetical protein
MQTGRLHKAEWTYTDRNTARKYRALMSRFTKYPDGDYVTLRESNFLLIRFSNERNYI